MEDITFSNYKDEIGAAVDASAKASGREKGNMEDQIRVANDLLRGLKVLGDENAVKLEEELHTIITNFATSFY